MNEQLAKIDGWENIRRNRDSNSCLEGDFRSDERFHGNDIPDYRNDLNELVRLAMERFPLSQAKEIILGAVVRAFNSLKPEMTIKDALARAIIEAAG